MGESSYLLTTRLSQSTSKEKSVMIITVENSLVMYSLTTTDFPKTNKTNKMLKLMIFLINVAYFPDSV